MPTTNTCKYNIQINTQKHTILGICKIYPGCCNDAQLLYKEFWNFATDFEQSCALLSGSCSNFVKLKFKKDMKFEIQYTKYR